MTAVAGSVEFKTFTVGGMDLNDPKIAKKLEVNIYYDILKPVVLADVKVLDENDSLGTFNISGKEDVKIQFGVPGGQEEINLKLKLFQNKNLEDDTNVNKGAMKHKTYDFRMVSPELLTNQSKRLQKSFKQNTDKTVKDAIKHISDKEVNTPDGTKGEQRIIANYERVFDFLRNINERHVSQQNKSSLYTLFPTYENGTEKYTFATFEHLMKQGSKFDFKQDNTVGARTTTDGDQMKNLLWVNVPQSFNTPVRANSDSNRNTYNSHTGKWQGKNNEEKQYNVLGQPVFKNEPENQPNKQRPPRDTLIDPSNDKKKTDISDAKIDRAKFLAHLTQNTMKFEIHGNPAIKVGDVISLNIPKKADADQESGEKQMNDKVLIVRIRHKIKPLGVAPQYTMIIEAVKAAFKEGGA